MARPEQVLTELFLYVGCDISPEFIARASGMLKDDSTHARMLRTNVSGDFDAEFDAYLEGLNAPVRDELVRSARDFGYEL